MMNASSNRELSILSFWHKLEFFTPFDAKQKIETAQEEGGYHSFSMDELQKLPKEKSIFENILEIPSDKEYLGATIYLNLFSNSKISKTIQDILQEELTEEEKYAQEVMDTDDGITCYASLEVDKNNALDIQKTRLSTLPWALGLSSKEGFSALNSERFKQDCQWLKERLSSINQRYRDTSVLEENESVDENELSPAVLLEIIDSLNQWSYAYNANDFSYPIIGICLRWKKKSAHQEKSKDKNALKAYRKDGGDSQEEDDSILDEIGILNSFYAQDIHRIISKIGQGYANEALSSYLKMKPNKVRKDLYSEQGDELIWQVLRPKYWNRGRWLSESTHGLSLMQQFAVNVFFKEREQAVFSVNGPPGTGKTTLLRDIFAENIVQRAMKLAELSTPEEALVKNLSNGIYTLKPELTGFEMVVASSNNAAVENISRDLPKQQSLGKMYQEGSYTYLQTVARNLVTQQTKKNIMPLSDEDVWGLFSCALGKKANRNKVVSGLYFRSRNIHKDEESFYDSLWTWRDNYHGVSFIQAKKAFHKQLELVEQRLSLLDDCFDLHERVVLKNNIKQLQQQYDEYKENLQHIEKEIGIAQEQLNQATQIEIATIQIDDRFATTILNAENHIQRYQAFLEDCDVKKKHWEHKIKSEECKKPGFFAKLFRTQDYKAYQQSLGEYHHQLAQLYQKESECKVSLQRYKQELQSAQHGQQQEKERLYKQAVNTAKSYLSSYKQQYSDCEQNLDRVTKDLEQAEEEQQEYKSLLSQFPELKLPASYDELRQNDFQILGLWKDERLNHERSSLFGCALQLHEAWLAEVSKKNGKFAGNLAKLSDFLQGSAKLTNEQILSLWQSLFMIVPVVSSTFASFANQFQGLDARSLGYLFIDEAGQAIPQAAVGAIWRAKRVMVVGDPIQIDPVFTAPIPLVRHLEKIARFTEDVTASPLDVSVQVLADKCNNYGANITQEGEAKWIGSPLRVHRRCLEPMFKIANKIAYEEKMILSETDPSKQWPDKKDDFHLGDSAWVQVEGQAVSRQFVPEQAEVVINMLINIVNVTGKLPELYIITPFKQIKHKLIEQVLASVDLKGVKGLCQWCNTRIGTVHTFQGKEEKMVWFVLGCDKTTEGAAQWAASKPNLLNVALTRAKRYVFLIGDQKIWSNKPYFKDAAKELPQISIDEFLLRLNPLTEKLSEERHLAVRSL